MGTVEQVIEVVADRLGKPVDEVKPESNFVEDLDADSLDLVDDTASGRVCNAAEQGHASIDSDAGDLDHAPPFRFGMQWSFAGGTADKAEQQRKLQHAP